MAGPNDISVAMGSIIVEDDGSPTPLPDTGIGAPVSRLDGPDKVSGAAVYAGERSPEGVLHGVFVFSPFAKGELKSINKSAALAATGVVQVIVPADMPQLGAPAVPPSAQSFLPMSDNAIRYEGQPIAIVLAETFEQAQAGAALVEYEIEQDFPDTFEAVETVDPNAEGNGYAFQPLSLDHGDLDAGFDNAAAIVEQTYTAATRHHNMMEPSTTFAEWRGDELHMHDATQWTYGIRYALSGVLNVPIEKMHVRCPYTGGGFGAKGYVWPHQFLTPIAARLSGRPVKLSVGRQGNYTSNGYQPIVQSNIKIGANPEGKLTSFYHESVNLTSRFDDYIEYGTAGSRAMYATDAYSFRTRVRRADVSNPTPMRAPHEGPGMFGTESAVDELAYELGIDPLEFRLRNYAETDVHTGRPYSSKKLREAYLVGADRFGWSEREAAPRSHREGSKLIGTGVASAVMSTFRFPSTARIILKANGLVDIEVGTQEIGTGPRTIFAQVAAERLGISDDRVNVVLGATSLPETGGTFGSSTTMSVGSAVKAASENLLEKLNELAPDGVTPAPDAWPDLLASRGIDRLQAEGTYSLPGGAGFDAHGGSSGFAMHSYGAVFVEMEVDEALGLARMRRAYGCYSAGRILNPKTARSQMIGGIIWGYGRAMLEKSTMDERFARYTSKNLSGVYLPVNADIPRNIDISFINENDPHSSALGARGIGELGEVGVAAAITNAIYHATGKRIRELPVKFPDLMA